MKQSLKQKLLVHLRANKGYTHGGELEKLSESWGYKGSTGSRVLRTLAEGGLIFRKENEKGHVLYGAGEPKEIIEYKVDNLVVATKYIW
jgi:predicted transcriptional regulator